MRLIGVRSVSKIFANGVQALANVSLDVETAEFLSVLGPSGCGKSTLLRLIAGLIEPSAGAIEWPGNKADIGFVFQEPTLMPWATALANVALPLRLRGLAKGEREARGRSARPGRAQGLRTQLAAPTVGRHEDARVDRPRVGDRAQAPADG